MNGNSQEHGTGKSSCCRSKQSTSCTSSTSTTTPAANNGTNQITASAAAKTTPSTPSSGTAATAATAAAAVECKCCGWGCNCGPNCQCTRELCLCAASSLVGALHQPRPQLWATWNLLDWAHDRTKAQRILSQSGSGAKNTTSSSSSSSSTSDVGVTVKLGKDAKIRRPVESKQHALQLTEELENRGVPSILESLQVVTKGEGEILQLKNHGKPYRATYSVGMTCGGCVKTVRNILGDLVEVNLETKRVILPVDTEEQAQAMVEELEDVGGLETTLLSVEKVGLSRSNSITPERRTSSSIIASPVASSADSKSKSNGSRNSSSVSFDPLLTPLLPNVQLRDAAIAMEFEHNKKSETNVVRKDTTETAEIIVSGMTCAMCVKAITNALLLDDRKGVQEATVSVATNMATVHYEPSIVSTADLTEIIEDAGYQVEDVFVIPKHDINGHPGTATSTAERDTAPNRLERLTNQQQLEVQRKKRAFLWSLVGTMPILIITMILPHVLSETSALLVWLHQPVHFRSNGANILRESLLLWVLATPVQFGSGWAFYKTAYHNLQTSQLGMDVLVALGTTASYGYAAYQALQGEEAHFFETSSVLICFVLLGKWMNTLAVRRTSDALLQLMQLQAKTAIWVRPRDSDEAWIANKWDASIGPKSLGFNPMVDPILESVVPVEVIQPGHVVKLIRGASIPADGVVTHGELTVDESMITGESVPILKTPGSPVIGGTVCVEGSGAFACVTGVGAQTALHQIVALVQEAQTRQVPIQSLADTISAIFVPAVCTLSVVTFLIWYALCSTGSVPEEWYELEGGPGTFSLMFGIACLVISCPCALGLATPTAVMVGTGVGARYGVLMKGGEGLELAAKVNAVIFDKTGTLTKGKPAVTDFRVVPGKPSATHRPTDSPSRNKKQGTTWDPNDVLWRLCCLERNSEHPLAMAVVSYAESRLSQEYINVRPYVQAHSFKALTGRGATGIVDRTTISIGNRAYYSERKIDIDRDVDELMTMLEEEGKTAIVGAIDNEIVVVLGLADELKQGAKASLQFLQSDMNIDVWMVTGDNARTARAVAEQLGLDNQNRVISEALPIAKVEQVKKLQAEGKIVAMIGDGINDSPALTTANVGISLGTGAEIAAEASDMVLVKGDVQDVCTALHLSRVIVRRIQWNFVFSLIYNCLGIPIAAGALFPLIHTRLPPTMAALAMALSSVSVVLSSLALRLYRPPIIRMSSDQQQPNATGNLEGENGSSLLNQWRRRSTQVMSNLSTSSRNQDLMVDADEMRLLQEGLLENTSPIVVRDSFDDEDALELDPPNVEDSFDSYDNTDDPYGLDPPSDDEGDGADQHLRFLQRTGISGMASDNELDDTNRPVSERRQLLMERERKRLIRRGVLDPPQPQEPILEEDEEEEEEQDELE